MYAISSDVCGVFSKPNGGFGKNVIIFGACSVDLCMLMIIKNDIIILGRSPTQGLDDITWTAKVEYSINFV